jgi:hypothetical protein
MGTSVVSLSWKVAQCVKVLRDQENYKLVYDVPGFTNGSKLDHSEFNSDYMVQVGSWLHEHLLYLKKYIDPDGTKSLPGFYMIPKVHKTPVAECPICDIYSSVTWLVFTLVSKLLIVIHEKLSKQFHNTVLKPFYTVCLLTDEALVRTKRVHGLNTSKVSHFHSRDFVSMYPNLIP